MPRIVLSSRRADSAVIVRRIFARLVDRYGHRAVFLNIDNIPHGADFRQAIDREIGLSDVLLVIVGPDWLRMRSEPAIASDTEVINFEIETGLRRGIPIIPVLVRGATMPRANDLPEPLRDFAFRNAIKIDSGPDFDAHVRRLITSLDRLFDSRLAASAPPPLLNFAAPGSPAPSQAPSTAAALSLPDLLARRRAAYGGEGGRPRNQAEAYLAPPGEAPLMMAPLLSAPPMTAAPSSGPERAARRRSAASVLAIAAAIVGAIAIAAIWLALRARGTPLQSGSLPLPSPIPEPFGPSALAAVAAAVTPHTAEAPTDTVDVSAFAPLGARVGEEVLVQVFLHAIDDAAAAERLAREADPTAARRGIATLEAAISRSTRVEIHLEAKDLAIDEPIQSLIWRGEPSACQFIVESRSAGRHLLRVRVLLDGVPVGSLRFTLEMSRSAQPSEIMIRGDRARRYSRAFLSYASPDRAEVLKRAQALRVAGLDFFQDVLSLDPGQRWEHRLYREIDACDLFLLFWSSSAAGSEWVLREAQYALDRQAASDDDAPDITPVVLEGPPVPLPPDTLKHLHFNDYIRYLIAGEESTSNSRAGG